LIVAIVLFQTLSLPSSKEAMKFLFYPDFSSLRLNSLGSAIGHVFFTLSIGLGTMITFGSYMKESDHIPTAGFRVASLDIVLSLLGAMIVFPIAMLATEVPLTDPGLLFEALPKFFSKMTAGSYFGFLFFLCLYIAALAASITLMEVVSTNLTQKTQDIMSSNSKLAFINRNKSAIIVFVVALLISLLPAMSSSFLSAITVNEKSLLQVIDAILVEFLLPIIAIVFCFVISKGISEIDKERLFIDQRKLESQSLFPYWKFSIKYFIPVVVLTGIVLSVVSFFI
jgi:NSS family neurotransmitter:Na+ symporter